MSYSGPVNANLAGGGKERPGLVLRVNGCKAQLITAAYK